MKTSGTGTLERYVMHNMSPIKAFEEALKMQSEILENQHT